MKEYAYVLVTKWVASLSSNCEKIMCSPVWFSLGICLRHHIDFTAAADLIWDKQRNWPQWPFIKDTLQKEWREMVAILTEAEDSAVVISGSHTVGVPSLIWLHLKKLIHHRWHLSNLCNVGQILLRFPTHNIQQLVVWRWLPLYGMNNYVLIWGDWLSCDPLRWYMGWLTIMWPSQRITW